MGLGDEIMALGRAELVYEQTGRPVSICTMTECPREHDAWVGNPAWEKNAGKKIIDGGGARAYIKNWHGRQCNFNMDHTARAGRIYLTEEERARCTLEGPYAIVAPNLKETASKNKIWCGRAVTGLIRECSYCLTVNIDGCWCFKEYNLILFPSGHCTSLHKFISSNACRHSLEYFISS